MFGNCSCDDLELETIPRNTCAFDIGQVIKLGVQKQQAAGSPTFANLAAAESQSNWQTLLDADDETKIVITPITENLVIPPSDAILEGGDDNSTFDGMPIALGGSSPRATGMIASITPAIRRALKKIICVQTLDTPVTLFYITKNGIFVQYTEIGEVDIVGVPAYAFFVGDPGIEGKNTRNKTPISFSLAYGWADNLVKIEPDFDVLTELYATES